jgi:hypothetical protein
MNSSERKQPLGYDADVREERLASIFRVEV